MGREQIPNDLFRAARERLSSPSGAPRAMSRQELADAVNTYLYREHKAEEKLNQDDIGRIERGRTRWPGHHRRAGLRAVLGAATDTALGFYFHRASQDAISRDLGWPTDRGCMGGEPPAGVSSDARAAAGAPGASLHTFGMALPKHATAIDPSLLAGCRDVAESLAGMYRAVDPRAVLSIAATYADELLDLYGQHAYGRPRRDLATLVVGVHCQVGLWACHAHEPSRARRYLATACDVAVELDDDSLHARTLGALSYLHSSAPRGGTGGNPRRALELLTRALASKVDGFTRGWLATWRADQYATLGDLPAARADVELADAALGVGDDGPEHGFFSRRHYGYGMRGHLESVRGLVYALAGELDESEQVFTKVQAQAANGRRRVATAAHQALAFTRATQPEAACQALEHSITLAITEPYPMGLKRVRGVRAEFDQSWASLPCVRDLDQRLSSLAPADA